MEMRCILLATYPPEQPDPVHKGPRATPADVQSNKWIAALAYILFFLPLLAAKESRFAMYHGNQGLVLLLTTIAANVVLGLIPFLGFLLLPIINLALLVLTVMGILNAAKGLMKPLPLIGSFSIIKVP